MADNSVNTILNIPATTANNESSNEPTKMTLVKMTPSAQDSNNVSLDTTVSFFVLIFSFFN